MYLSSGHVTLLQGEFQAPKLFLSRTYGAGRPYVELCPKFLVFVLFIHCIIQCKTVIVVWLYFSLIFTSFIVRPQQHFADLLSVNILQLTLDRNHANTQ